MNKLNVTLLLIIASLLVMVLSGQTKQPQAANQPGRYQLLSGESHTLGGTPDKYILRIDTQTGNVDEWMVGERKGGGVIDKWIPISN